MSDVRFIEQAFGSRIRPRHIRDATKASDEIYSDADIFKELDWRDVTCDLLERHRDAIYGFLPEAFCYFLPGIYTVGIQEGRPELLVNHGLIAMLDRGNAPGSWDEFFRQRWRNLTSSECEATQRWILWLAAFNPGPIADASLSRAYDIIDLLANQGGASPIAAWPK